MLMLDQVQGNKLGEQSFIRVGFTEHRPEVLLVHGKNREHYWGFEERFLLEAFEDSGGEDEHS